MPSAHVGAAAISRPNVELDRLLGQTQRLVDILHSAVAFGLGLDRARVESNLDLSEVVRRWRRVDVERISHFRRILHARSTAIVARAARTIATSHLTPDQVARVDSVQLACRAAVDVVREVGVLQPNAGRYMRGENAAMYLQYAFIRRGVASCLRHLAPVVRLGEPALMTTIVDELERDARRRDALADGTVHRLLRAHAITPSMAATLMIDSARALAIERKLVAVAVCVVAAAKTGGPPPHGPAGSPPLRHEAS